MFACSSRFLRRQVSESNNALGTILAGLGSKLESLRSGAERLMKPTDEALPRYDDVRASVKVCREFVVSASDKWVGYGGLVTAGCRGRAVFF